MAENQLSAAVRPRPRVRRTATHTGVTHIRHHQPDRYTIIGNHLAQHRELSLTAVGLATHILSLPEGASVDIRTLAARFPEGRDRIAFALRELEAQGYLERVRERTPNGRVITRTYACNDPAAGRVPAVPPPAAPLVSPAPAPAPAVPRAVPVRPAAPESAVAAAASLPPRAPLPADPPEAPERADAPRNAHHGTALALLAGLRRADDRLTLAERDVRRLAPALTAWLDNGATPAAVHRTLTTDLPPDLQHPAGLLAHRLRELLPPPLPAASVAPSDGATKAGCPPLPFQTCDGCDRAFRARQGGLCRDCRHDETDAAGADAA